MSVYVDSLMNHGWRFGPSCHMLADSEEELHTFAEKIGLKRAWFQNKHNDTPHYDLTANKRKAAILNGAIEIDNKQLYKLIQHHRVKVGLLTFTW